MMEHLKVYPFTVSLPRYASWRKYAQALLKQLKACPACRGSADGFPVSILPKTHKLPNGKLLVFKGLTAATDQGALCTNDEVVEEYDMVSIDPNCPRHGKYSRTAWLSKQGTRSGAVKVRPRQQVVSTVKNQNQQNAINKKTDGVRRMFSSSLCKPDTKPDCVLKERGGENLEPNGQTQFVASTKSVAARKDLKYMSSVLVQKQLNIPSVRDQEKDFVSRRHSVVGSIERCGPLDSQRNERTEGSGREFRSTPVLECEKDVLRCEESYASQFRRIPSVRDQEKESVSRRHSVAGSIERCGPLDSQRNERTEGSGREFRSTPVLECEKDVLRCEESYASQFRKIPSVRDQEKESVSRRHSVARSIERCGPLDSQRNEMTQECGREFRSTPVLECEKDVFKREESYASQFRRTPSVRDQEKEFVSRRPSVARSIERCGSLDSQSIEMTEECGREFRSTPALESEKDGLKYEESYTSQFRRMCLLKKPYDTYHEQVETEAQDKKLLERVSKMDSSFQTTSVDVPSHDHIADGCSTCSTNRVPQKEEPLATHKSEELQQTSDLVERLNKIANAARALQAELEDHRVGKGTPVQLAQAQVVDKKDARQWMLDTAIEKAMNKIPGDHEGRKVRHLVQAFESIKVALLRR